MIASNFAINFGIWVERPVCAKGDKIAGNNEVMVVVGNLSDWVIPVFWLICWWLAGSCLCAST
jgi:hypothetical protein